MTALDDAFVAFRTQVDSYGQTQYTQGKADQSLTDAAALASVQQQLEAADLEVTDLTAEVADLKVQLAAAQADDDPPVDPPPVKTLPLFGASMQNNGDPAPLEKAAGRVLGVHRTYYNLTQINAAIAQAKADIAAGRVPLLSFKFASTYTNGTWAQVVAGKYDAQLTSLAAALATVPGLVKVALHHEPEGDDSDMTQFPLMQDHAWGKIVWPSNVEPWVIYTGGDTDTSAKLAALYPKTAKPNLGFDKYNRYGDASHPANTALKGWTEMKDFYAFAAAEAKKRGVKWGIGETGYTDVAFAHDPKWLDRAYDDAAAADPPGDHVSYFNSQANSNGTWSLSGAKLGEFVVVLKRSR